MATVPITPEVLEWAVAESGLDVAQVSGRIKSDVAEWIAGRSQPTVGQVRELARVLDRPMATFLLSRVPETEQPRVQFRHSLNEDRDEMNFEERKALREAARQQRMMRWIGSKLE